MATRRTSLLLLLITASVGATLPLSANSSLCSEQEWNKALTSQQILDYKYNLLATQYNHWLPGFKQAIFLYQEFSHAELLTLWNNNRHGFQTTLRMQRQSAAQAIAEIDQLLRLLDITPPLVEKQRDRWYRIGEDCKQRQLMTNVLATELYLKANKSVSLELSRLRHNLLTMRRDYQSEIRLLNQVIEHDSDTLQQP